MSCWPDGSCDCSEGTSDDSRLTTVGTREGRGPELTVDAMLFPTNILNSPTGIDGQADWLRCCLVPKGLEHDSS